MACKIKTCPEYGKIIDPDTICMACWNRVSQEINKAQLVSRGDYDGN